MSFDTDIPKAGQPPRTASGMVVMVVFLFFAWGFATVLIDTLIPRLKSLFELSYAEVMLTQFCFFLGYFIFSLPAARVLARIGYIRTIVLGLGVMAIGCLLFSPAAALGLYPGFLLALFVMSAGITTLQVAANPLIAILGPPRTSHSRLTLAQAFNSLGTTLGPLVGAWLVLSAGVVSPAQAAAMDQAAKASLRVVEAHAMQLPFLGIAAALAIVAIAFWMKRAAPVTATASNAVTLATAARLLRNPRFALGVLSIFIYVGAEVSIGSLMVNYLMQASVLAVAAARAGQLVSLYWGGAMVGRFIGSAVLRTAPPGATLMTCALVASALAVTSSATTGIAAAVTVIAIGLFNSVMFPTIFTLALEGLDKDTPQGSGILCMAIVGGAIVPVLTGLAADRFGLAAALLIPAVCYIWLAFYGVLAWRTPGMRAPQHR